MRRNLTNPKDLIGVHKVDLSLIPLVGMLHTAHAMMDGEAKYTAANWLKDKVSARIYVAAIKRHLDLWAAGEELADDSHVHHLGHASSGLHILMDAQANGQMVDDRIKNPAAVIALKHLNKQIQMEADARNAREEAPRREADGIPDRRVRRPEPVERGTEAWDDNFLWTGQHSPTPQPLPASLVEVETEGQDRDADSAK